MAFPQAFIGTRPARWRAVLAITAACAALLACERTTRDTDIKFMSVSEAKNLLDRIGRGDASAAAFIDPRPAKEFAESHIPGARNLTLPQVKPKAKPDPRLVQFAVLIVYGNDPASATARGMTKRLIEVGYDKVRFFAGGLEEWNNRNYPLERAPTPIEPKPVTTEKKPE